MKQTPQSSVFDWDDNDNSGARSQRTLSVKRQASRSTERKGVRPSHFEFEDEDGLSEIDDSDEEEVQWRIEGHKWVGKEIVRVFDEHEQTRATCTKWAEADASGPALWHVVRTERDALSRFSFVHF